MRFVSLSSGSKGNSALVDTGYTRLLIDCGISARSIEQSLYRLGLSLGDIDAVILTHEHSDHIRGLKRLMNEFKIPCYGTLGTLWSLPGVLKDEYFEREGRSLMEEVNPGKEFTVGDIAVTPFKTYHDAAEPCGYRMEIWQSGEGTRKHVEIGVLTDCGHYDERIVDTMKHLDAMILETNHDIEMLKSGRYPDFLKRRILSPRGHLSNDSGGEILRSVVSPKLRSVLLGHLSEENNTAETALNTVRKELTKLYGSEEAIDIDISVAPQHRLSAVIEL